MLAFLLALFIGFQPDAPAVCERKADFRQAILDARSGQSRDEALQALAFRVRQERQRDPEAACAPDLLRTEALALLFLEEYAESLAILDRLLAEYDVDADMAGRTHTNRGYLLTRLGRTAEAALAYAAAAELADEVDPALGAQLLLEASKTYRLLRQYDLARRYLEAATVLADQAGDPVVQGNILSTRAMQHDVEAHAYRSQRDSLASAGIEHARRALRLLGDQQSTAHQAFRTRIVWAELHIKRGELDEAAAVLAEAEARRGRVEQAFPLAGLRLDFIRADLAHRQGRLDEAKALARQTLRGARRLNARSVERETLTFLGNMVSFSDPQQAERFYRQAMVAAEANREALGFQDWSVSAFERDQAPYRALAAVLIRQGRHEDAFVLLDAIRARYLRDLRSSAALRRTLGPEQRETLAAHYETLRQARDSLADPALSQSERTRHERAIAEEQAAIERLTGARPAPPRPLSLPALHAALGRREQRLVAYFLHDETAAAFVVSADTFAIRTLPTTEPDVEAAVDALGGLRADAGGTAPPLDALHHLYALLFAPIADLMPEGESVVVIPEGPLGAIPFSLLVEAPTGRFGYADAPFLVRRHALSTELAASLIVESGAPAVAPVPERAFVAFGRSQFDAAPRSVRSASALGPLPAVPAELERIVAELGRGEAFLDADATEHRLERMLEEPRLLHLATHVLPNVEFPLYSHAILWDDPEADDDGVLHAYEIEDRLLDLDLVVLSGCDTGRGRGQRGEGMRSLQYAFRAAGARSTVATLWQVDDRAMAFVMDRFYHHLGKGARKDVALQRAQLDYLDGHEGALASPTLWAPAVLYGDPSPLDWTEDRGGALGWVLLGLGALALLALPIAYRRRLRARTT
jgi:hypothetical protein